MSMIRREDKEIIHNLSLLGMLFGAFVGGFLILHTNKQAHLRLDAEAAAAQTQNSLVRLSSNLTGKEASLAQAAIGQVETEVQPDTDDGVLGQNLWVTLNHWGMWGICAGAALAGGTFGYLTLWGTSWIGSVLTYWMIRKLYGQIRTVAPACSAARRPTLQTEANIAFQRDHNRLLPTLIKLFMLLAIALSVLAVVVWQLTAI